MKKFILLVPILFIVACNMQPHIVELEMQETSTVSNIELIKTRVMDTLTAKNDSVGGLEWFSEYKEVYFKETELFDRLYVHPTTSDTVLYDRYNEECRHRHYPEIVFSDSYLGNKNEIMIPVAISWEWVGLCVSEEDINKILEEEDFKEMLVDAYYFVFNKDEDSPQITKIYYSPDCDSSQEIKDCMSENPNSFMSI